MANVNREALIETGGRIAALRAELQRVKQELKAAESELDRLLGGEPSTEAPVPLPKKAAEREDEMSLNRQIVEIIDGLDPLEDLNAETVLLGLPDETNISSVRSALARLADQKKIRRIKRGHYGKIVLPERAAS